MQSELKACPFCGGEAKTVRDSGNEVWPQSWTTGCTKCRVMFKVMGSNSWAPVKKEDQEAERKSIAAWNTRAEGDADHQREGVLRMYVVAFCALIEGLADAADIDLAETEMTMEANGKQLAARSVEQMIADAKKLTGAHAALKTSTGEGK